MDTITTKNSLKYPVINNIVKMLSKVRDAVFRSETGLPTRKQGQIWAEPLKLPDQNTKKQTGNYLKENNQHHVTGHQKHRSLLSFWMLFYSLCPLTPAPLARSVSSIFVNPTRPNRQISGAVGGVRVLALLRWVTVVWCSKFCFVCFLEHNESSCGQSEAPQSVRQREEVGAYLWPGLSPLHLS